MTLINTGYKQSTIAYYIEKGTGKPVDVNDMLCELTGEKQAIAILQGTQNPNPQRYEVIKTFMPGEVLSEKPTRIYDTSKCPVIYQSNISVNPQKIILSPTTNTQSVTVTSDGTWEITDIDTSMFTAYPERGNNTRVVEISLKKPATTGMLSEIVFTSKTSGNTAVLTVEISVDDMPFVDITPKYHDFKADAINKSITLYVNSNTTWEIDTTTIPTNYLSIDVLSGGKLGENTTTQVVVTQIKELPINGNNLSGNIIFIGTNAEEKIFSYFISAPIVEGTFSVTPGMWDGNEERAYYGELYMSNYTTLPLTITSDSDWWLTFSPDIEYLFEQPAYEGTSGTTTVVLKPMVKDEPGDFIQGYFLVESENGSTFMSYLNYHGELDTILDSVGHGFWIYPSYNTFNSNNLFELKLNEEKEIFLSVFGLSEEEEVNVELSNRTIIETDLAVDGKYKRGEYFIKIKGLSVGSTSITFTDSLGLSQVLNIKVTE